MRGAAKVFRDVSSVAPTKLNYRIGPRYVFAASVGLVYLQSHVFGENKAPSRSTPQMMQVTRAAFQAVASLNEQATKEILV